MTALPAIAVILFISWPMLFTSSGMGEDWSNHLWEMWRQSLSIYHEHRASLFLNFEESVFYPLYAFYGGTLYVLTGTLSVLLGNAPVSAYVVSWMIGFAAAFGGWCWLGRMAGLGRWSAQVPGLLFITSAYYLTLIYPIGDWAELLTVSMIPLGVAAALSVLRMDRVKLPPALALAASTLVFFGGHNITVLWGLSLLALLAAALVLAVPAAREMFTRRGVLRVLAIAVPAALVNAWYLVPDVAYASRTSIAHAYHFARELHALAFLVSAFHLFTPFYPFESSDTPDFSFALPVVAVILVVVGIAVSIKDPAGGPWRRVLWVLSGFTLSVGILMTHPGLILDLPSPYPDLQFGLRLESYVLLGICGAVLSILVLASSWPPPWRSRARTGAAIALVVAGAAAIQQVSGYPSGTNRSPRATTPDRYAVFAPGGRAPATTTGLGCEPGVGCGFDDNSLPFIPSHITEHMPEIRFPPSAVHDDRVSIIVHEPAGARVVTNLSGAPYFVTISGAQAVGRDWLGHVVLKVSPAAGNDEVISLSAANSLPVVLGRIITFLALAWLAVMLVIWLARRLVIGKTPSRSA